MKILNDDLALLMSFNDDIAGISDGTNLFMTIFKKLNYFYDVRMAGLAIYDKTENSFGFVMARPPEDVDDLLKSMIWLKTIPINDLPFSFNEGLEKIFTIDSSFFKNMNTVNKEHPDFQSVCVELGIQKLIMIPIKTSGAFMGYIMFAENEFKNYGRSDAYTIKIANFIGTAITNIKSFEELKRKQKEKEMQLSLIVDLVKVKDINSFHQILAAEIDKLIPCEYIALYSNNANSSLSISASLIKNSSNNFEIFPTGRNHQLSLLALSKAASATNGINHTEVSDETLSKMAAQFAHIRTIKEKHGINTLAVIQYNFRDYGSICLILGRSSQYQWMMNEDNLDFVFTPNKSKYFANKELELGSNLIPQISLILGNIYAFEEINVLTKRLEQEKNFLLEEINLSNSFQEIIGTSQPIQNVLNKITLVAPLDATVLVLGETGTGKELIAKAIHNLSSRKDNAFITVNCAALPIQLIESELFGHEKGSFTGAVEKRIGKFEVADGGTIFLDEIGELPMEVQSKLLRVLQEKEFERIGGKSTIHTNVRIIAATNRNLELEIKNGKFRADLFFRLNVFPLSIPPLRERADDIPSLVKHFIEKYSKRIGKNVKSIAKKDLDLLTNYNWPGNIRELEHIIERAIIISEGSNLTFDNILPGNSINTNNNIETFKTLEQLEKEHIVEALRLTKGKVTGDNSASALLGINGKTLGSKMRKFGIKREIVISA